MSIALFGRVDIYRCAHPFCYSMHGEDRGQLSGVLSFLHVCARDWFGQSGAFTCWATCLDPDNNDLNQSEARAKHSAHFYDKFLKIRTSKENSI